MSSKGNSQDRPLNRAERRHKGYQTKLYRRDWFRRRGQGTKNRR